MKRKVKILLLSYAISRKELNKRKPKVLKKDVHGAQNEHRNAEPVIAVLKKMKEIDLYRAG